MKVRILVTALGLALSAEAAQAATLVLGGGDAQACYREAARGSSANSTVVLCSRAIDTEALDTHDRAATYVNLGVVLLRQRAWAQAIADFDIAIRIRPDLGDAWVNRGAAKLATARPADALSDIDKAIELGVTEPEKAWVDRGYAHEALGDTHAAYDDYTRASELKPGWDLPKAELARFKVRPASQG